MTPQEIKDKLKVYPLVIDVRIIPHKEQRYNTCGDWQFSVIESLKEVVLHIKVSKLDDWKMESLIAQHEIDEALLCLDRNIPEEVVYEFDINFEGDEPGAAPNSPYYKEHQFANHCESLRATAMNINWEEYEAKLISLGA